MPPLVTRDFLPSRILVTDRPSCHPCSCRTAIAFAPLCCSPWFRPTPWQQGLRGRLSSHCHRGATGAQVVEPKRALLPRKPEHFPLHPLSTQSFPFTQFHSFFCTPISRKSQHIPNPHNPNPASCPFALALAQWLRGGGEDSSGSVMTWRRRGQGKLSLLRNALGWIWTIAPILQSQPKSGVKG